MKTTNITTMRHLKHMSLLTVILSVLAIYSASCSNNDEDDTIPAPSVVLNDANLEGDELCVEADIVAKGRTASIAINIYDPASNTVKVAHLVTESKYIGVLNIKEFHVHVDIAGKGVAVGDQLRLTVTDANGKTTTAVKDITEEEEDEHHA